MKDNQPISKPAGAATRNGRPTIGVLISHQTHKNDYSMWQGVVDAARKRDVNVVCFVGLWLDSPYGFEAQANVIYDLVSAERLDGLVIMAGAITQQTMQRGFHVLTETETSIPYSDALGDDAVILKKLNATL